MADTLFEFIDKLKAFSAHDQVLTIVEDHGEMLADLQRHQMLEGRGVDGEFIKPGYSENPYFKTPEAGLRYGRWKQKITPNPQRPVDTPNLIINGFFHKSIYAKFNGDDFEMESDAPFGEEVFAVHKNAQGLNEEKRLLFAENVTVPEFRKVLHEKTGLQF